ncbi:MAG: FAD:protein FMN transferase [Tannerellaceae bacterium]|nr:FAD:protein FMN transferase [Tannerellaceae bacterium]
MTTIPGIYKTLAGGKSMYYMWFSAMHTRIDIMLCDRTETESKETGKLVYDEIRQLECAGNYFDPASELYQLNQKGYPGPVTVSRPLFAAIWECLDYYRSTAGCFDITIHSSNHHPEMIQGVHTDIAKSAISFNSPDLKLNLSGFLKGYVLEVVRCLLNRYHIKNALVNIGNSSVLAMGNHPLYEGWKVGIDFNGKQQREVTLFDECLTTSGNDSAERIHIRSPHSGKYMEGVKGVSVVTRQATEGEVLSTALCVASPAQREQILKNIPAVVYDLITS